MNALGELLGLLVAHGPMLLLGTTIVLAGGCLLMLLHRAPAQRRRLGIATACGCVAYLALALVPLPRVFGNTLDANPPPASATPATAVPATEAPLDPALRAETLLLALDRVLGPPAPAADTAGAPVAAPSAIPAAEPTASPTAPLPWATVLAFAWCFGACLVLLRSAWGLVCLHGLLRSSRTAPRTLLAGVTLPPRVTVRIARSTVRPFCTGWLRPTVVLGPELLEPGRRAQALAVVRHEAAHLRARDPLVQLLLVALAVPLFCHPLFWWLCRQVRFCSELLADDAAAASSRTAYARELIDLAGRDQPTLAAAGSVLVFHRPSDFYRRIQMLLQREAPLSTSTSRARRVTHALATLSLVAAAAGLFGVPATAQEPRARALRQENEALRAELDELRAQIGRLRDELRHAAVTPPPSGTAPVGGVPGLAPGGEAGPGGAPTPGCPAAPSLTKLPSPQGAPGAAPTPGYPDAGQNLQPSQAAIESAIEYQKRAGRAGDVTFGYYEALDRSLPAAGVMPRDPGVGAPPPAAGDPLPGTDRTRIGKDLPEIDYSRNTQVPLLGDIPVLDRLFVAGADGLPNQAVNVAPPERTATVATTEAIADLASRCLDLQADIEIAEVAATETKQLAEQGFTSTAEARKAAVQLRTLQKKLAIVVKLIAGEKDATVLELNWLEQKRNAADQTDRLRLDMQIHRARTRLETLEAVK